MPTQWLSCGRGYLGELGRSVKEKSENIVNKLDEVKTIPNEVKYLKCGKFHNLCVDDEGYVYAWGANLNGQLSYGDDQDQFAFCSEAKRVDFKGCLGEDFTNFGGSSSKKIDDKLKQEDDVNKDAATAAQNIPSSKSSKSTLASKATKDFANDKIIDATDESASKEEESSSSSNSKPNPTLPEQCKVVEASGGRTFSMFRTKSKCFISGRLPHREFSNTDLFEEEMREINLGHKENAGKIEKIECGSGHALILLNDGGCYFLHNKKLKLPNVVVGRDDLAGFVPVGVDGEKGLSVAELEKHNEKLAGQNKDGNNISGKSSPSRNTLKNENTMNTEILVENNSFIDFSPSSEVSKNSKLEHQLNNIEKDTLNLPSKKMSTLTANSSLPDKSPISNPSPRYSSSPEKGQKNVSPKNKVPILLSPRSVSSTSTPPSPNSGNSMRAKLKAVANRRSLSESGRISPSFSVKSEIDELVEHGGDKLKLEKAKLDNKKFEQIEKYVGGKNNGGDSPVVGVVMGGDDVVVEQGAVSPDKKGNVTSLKKNESGDVEPQVKVFDESPEIIDLYEQVGASVSKETSQKSTNLEKNNDENLPPSAARSNTPKSTTKTTSPASSKKRQISFSPKSKLATPADINMDIDENYYVEIDTNFNEENTKKVTRKPKSSNSHEREYIWEYLDEENQDLFESNLDWDLPESVFDELPKNEEWLEEITIEDLKPDPDLEYGACVWDYVPLDLPSFQNGDSFALAEDSLVHPGHGVEVFFFTNTVSTHTFQVEFQHKYSFNTHISGAVSTHAFQVQFQHTHFKHKLQHTHFINLTHSQFRTKVIDNVRSEGSISSPRKSDVMSSPNLNFNSDASPSNSFGLPSPSRSPNRNENLINASSPKVRQSSPSKSVSPKKARNVIENFEMSPSPERHISDTSSMQSDSELQELSAKNREIYAKLKVIERKSKRAIRKKFLPMSNGNEEFNTKSGGVGVDKNENDNLDLLIDETDIMLNNYNDEAPPEPSLPSILAINRTLQEKYPDKSEQELIDDELQKDNEKKQELFLKNPEMRFFLYKEKFCAPQRLEVVSKLKMDHKVLAVACGWEHALMIVEGGMVYGWGSGSHGQLGVSCHLPRMRPCLIPIGKRKELTNVTESEPCNKIACSARSSYARALTNKVYAWGSNEEGQLALGLHMKGTVFPNVIKSLSILDDVSKIVAGACHVGVLCKSGLAYTWGSGSYGQLGYEFDEVLGSRRKNDDTGRSWWIQTVPRRIPLSLGCVDLVMGAWHTYVMLEIESESEEVTSSSFPSDLDGVVPKNNLDENDKNQSVIPSNIATPIKKDFVPKNKLLYYRKDLPEILEQPSFLVWDQEIEDEITKELGLDMDIPTHPDVQTEEVLENEISKMFDIRLSLQDQKTLDILDEFLWNQRRYNLVQVLSYDKTCVKVNLVNCDTHPLADIPDCPITREDRKSRPGEPMVIKLAELAKIPAGNYVPPRAHEISDDEEDSDPEAGPPLDAPKAQDWRGSAVLIEENQSTVNYPPGPYSRMSYTRFARGVKDKKLSHGLCWDILDEAIWRVMHNCELQKDPEAPLRINLFEEFLMVRQMVLGREPRELTEPPEPAVLNVQDDDDNIAPRFVPGPDELIQSALHPTDESDQNPSQEEPAVELEDTIDDGLDVGKTAIQRWKKAGKAIREKSSGASRMPSARIGLAKLERLVQYPSVWAYTDEENAHPPFQRFEGKRTQEHRFVKPGAKSSMPTIPENGYKPSSSSHMPAAKVKPLSPHLEPAMPSKYRFSPETRNAPLDSEHIDTQYVRVARSQIRSSNRISNVTSSPTATTAPNQQQVSNTTPNQKVSNRNFKEADSQSQASPKTEKQQNTSPQKITLNPLPPSSDSSKLESDAGNSEQTTNTNITQKSVAASSKVSKGKKSKKQKKKKELAEGEKWNWGSSDEK